MSKLDKRAISILVIAILALSFVLPLVSVSAISIPTIDPPDEPYYVGDTLTLEGIGGEVTSGAAVKIYWDIAYGPDAWLLNTTTGNPDGSYDVEITIPDTLNGSHYIWVEDVATGLTNGELSLNVSSKLKTDISSGLPADDVEVTGTGFGDEQPVNITICQLNATDPYNVIWSKMVIDPGDDIETNEYGTFIATFGIPSTLGYGIYTINATDGFNVAKLNFTVGAAIILTPDEGPEGTVIEVSGRGFNKSVPLSFGNVTWDGTYTMAIVGDTVTTDSNGEFTLEVVAPSWGAGSWKIEVDDVNNQASDNFTITGECTIEVSPTYGSPGASITLKGYNFTQIAGTEIILRLDDDPDDPTNLGEVDTDSDGNFETTFISPAVPFLTYQVWANDTTYDVNASDTFKVGIIAFIINPTYGEAGTEVGVTGIGFVEGDYNLTFGDKVYENHGIVSSGGAISDPFYVPNFEPGTYDLTVIDTEENELTVQFEVTESTYVSINPAMAPNEYNVSIKGYNFADIGGSVDFDIYNVTADGEVDKEWAMDVKTNTDPGGHIITVIEKDGNFSGHWHVPLEDVISLGDYIVNVTGPEGLLVQVPFSVVEARVSVAPRKAQFDRGDMIQFDIKNDFKLPLAYIEIYDPSDILYWSTEEFKDEWWLLVDDLYTVPYYRQTAALNPMELQSDAPMGPWLYRLYYLGDELMNGTFSVGPSSAAQVEERLTEIWASMEDLSTDIDSITDELSGDIDALSGEIDDVVADVQDMVDDITADLAEELAGVASDTEAAVDELEGAIGDIAASQSELASDLEDSLQTSIAAKEAAEAAQQSASGLTTLVYGAIAASLIAALAAVVSLMQISKKIA